MFDVLRRCFRLLDIGLPFRVFRFWPHFDSGWYLARNPEVGASGLNPFLHFVIFGWREGRDPSPWLSTSSYYASHSGRARVGKTLPGVAAGRRDSREYRRTQRAIASDCRSARSLVVFFNVARDVIGGGMLSINRFAACARELLAGDADCKVAISGVPLGLRAIDFSMFKAAQPQVEFRFLVEQTDPERVWLFLPEAFAVDFGRSLSVDGLKWLHSRRRITIVVMDQNNDLMPSPDVFKETLFPITKNIVITTAHRQYCTDRLAARYAVPVKQLTPILPRVRHRRLEEKDPIILLSPDLIQCGPAGLTRERVIRRLQSALPDFKFVTVQKLSLEQYLDLASRAMFSLTFGEGLDGYFIEPVLGGGVAFAVYRPMFFPKEFEGEETVFLSWESLIKRMPKMVRQLSRSEREYAQVNQRLQGLLSSEYSYERSRDELAALLKGEVDHKPRPWCDVEENFANIKSYLEKEHGFSFCSLPIGSRSSGGLLAARTPDNLFLLHYGGEFYSVLYEVYVSGDYDLDLKPDCEYILIDIGANFALVGLFLVKKYSQIRACYAYEPAEPTARLAAKNIECNAPDVPIHLKMIGLSDEFRKKTLEYFPDWSTAFSTDDEYLVPYLKDTTAHLDGDKSFVEAEVVPAHTELAPIFASRGARKVVVKCDTQGAEFAIISDMSSSGLLKEVDIFVIESHFRDPAGLLAVLRNAGFEVRARLDSATNQVFTIYAYRR